MTLRPIDNLGVRVNSAGLFRWGPGWKLDATRTRAWPDLDLWALAAGQAIVQTAGGPIHLRPGSTLLLRGGSDYDFARVGAAPLGHYWVHFDFTDPRSSRPIPHQSLALPWFERRAQPDALSFVLLARCVREFRRGGAIPERNAATWLAAALLDLHSQPAGETEGNSVDRLQWIAEFCERVKDAPEATYSIRDLAARSGYDAAYVCRLFKERIGLSPRQFITVTRMRAAKSLLMESAMSVAAVAAAVGYKDAQYFSRHFHMAHGMSATRFRDRA